MEYKYDYAIFMGRYQPFHNGHMKIVQQAYKVAKELIIVMGSANRPRTIKNPFKADERREMIADALTSEEKERTHFIAQEDYFYSDTQWMEDVQKKVHAITWRKFTPGPTKICLIGHKKDASSYYLGLFPQWDSVDVENGDNINACDFRNELFETGVANKFYEKMPFRTGNYITTLVYNNFGEMREPFESLRREYEFIKKYKKQWEAAPYAPTFVTCDATVIQSGHVLLVKRRAEPGKGLWSVPGGFLKNVADKDGPADITMLDGCIRELNEETGIKVPEKVLRGNVKLVKEFGHPERSLRGRTVTHNALIRLPNGPLPKVKGSDDAEKARWVPLGEVRCDEMFEDHYDMIQILKTMGE